MGGANDYNPTLIGGASKLQNNLRKEGAIVNKHMKERALNQRRALSSINQNILGASLYPKVVNKGGFSGKDVNCDKNKNGLADPPNPRGLEEQAIRKQQHSPYQENTKPDLLLSDLEDHTAVDIEECEDVSVPMFVKHTEAVLDEVDSMDVDDPIIDIDSNDVEDPLAATEYVDGIYAFYKKSEISSVVAPNYMDYQSDINGKMRAILIDWLIEVHYKFELMNETLFLTVNIIDRFLEQQPVARKKLQLVGVTAMLLACKYEEISVPLVEDFVLISDKAYTTKEVLDMEKLMVNTLEFNMSVPTPYVFMMRYLKAAQSDRKLELLSFYIIELCMVEYEMLKFPPSLLAAAAVYTAQCSLCKFKQWTRTSEWYTDYSEDQLMDCSRLMVTFHQKAGTGKLTGVYRKYSSSKFGHMAKAQPADFLLDF